MKEKLLSMKNEILEDMRFYEKQLTASAAKIELIDALIAEEEKPAEEINVEETPAY